MHIEISEQRIGTHSVFHAKYYAMDGSEIEHRIYDLQVFHTRVRESDISIYPVPEYRQDECRELVIVTDRNGIIIPDYYIYLNHIRSGKPAATTRRRMGYALMYLYLYCDIHDKTIEELTGTDMERFIHMLSGQIVYPYDPDHDDVTRRDPKTINGILGMIRAFMEEMQVVNPNILDVRKKYTSKVISMMTTKGIRVRQPHSIRTVRRQEAAKHFKPEEIMAIGETAARLHATEVECFLRVAFATGIRGGEYCGLTMEDVKTRTIGDKTEYYLVLRNRVGDKDYCKGLVHPTNPYEYKTKPYQASHKEKIITQDVYDFIMRYYSDTRDPRRVPMRQLQQILENTRADSVEEDSDNVNHYIWLNSRHQRLTLQTLNNRIKKVLLAAGYELDQECRKQGVSHKLGRHSYAMYLTTYAENQANPVQLQELLHHASLASGEAYYTPTEEERVQLHTRFGLELEKKFFKRDEDGKENNSK